MKQSQPTLKISDLKSPIDRKLVEDFFALIDYDPMVESEKLEREAITQLETSIIPDWQRRYALELERRETARKERLKREAAERKKNAKGKNDKNEP